MRYFLILFYFVCVVSAKSSINFTDSDKKIVFHTYNFEFDKAYEVLNPLLISEPGNLKYYFLELGLKSMIIEKSVYDKNPADKWELKKKMNEEAIEYANDVVEKFEDVELTTENKFYLGCIYGYLGRMYGVTKSWMSAFSDGKTGRGLLEEVIEEEPDFYDAYLLLGMFSYYADRMGGFMGFVAGILGFSGDREEGIEYILKTYKNGYLLSDQAELLLIELYSGLEGNGFAALPLHRKFVSKYPNNDQMLNWYVRDLLKYELIDEAEKILFSDKANMIHPYHFIDYYNKIGDYEKSNELIAVSEAEEKEQMEYIQRRLDHIRKHNYLMMGDIAKSNSIEIDEEYEEIFESLEKDFQLTKGIYELGVAVRSRKASEDQLKVIASDPQTKNMYLDALQSYYSGIYYYQKQDWNNARKKFEWILFFDKEHYHYTAAQYLINIYEKIEVDKYKVENLVAEIEDKDYERLSFSVKDLVKKTGCYDYQNR